MDEQNLISVKCYCPAIKILKYINLTKVRPLSPLCES